MIILTGATGFIGQNLAQALIANNEDVIFHGRRSTPQPVLKHRYFSSDLGDNIINESWARDIETLIHCAGAVSDWGQYDEMVKGNVNLTQNTLQSFPNLTKVIFISSSSVYDPSLSAQTYRESMPDHDAHLNDYSKTKRLAEKLVENSKVKQRFILRPHAVYGVGETKILPRLLKSFRFGRFITINHGEAPCSFTHINNLVHAVMMALRSDLAGCEKFNIVDNEILSVRQVLEMICSHQKKPTKFWNVSKSVAAPIAHILEKTYNAIGTKAPPLLTPYILHQIADRYVLDISKAQALLGYDPQYTLKNSVKEILNALE